MNKPPVDTPRFANLRDGGNLPVYRPPLWVWLAVVAFWVVAALAVANGIAAWRW